MFAFIFFALCTLSINSTHLASIDSQWDTPATINDDSLLDIDASSLEISILSESYFLCTWIYLKYDDTQPTESYIYSNIFSTITGDPLLTNEQLLTSNSTTNQISSPSTSVLTNENNEQINKFAIVWESNNPES